MKKERNEIHVRVTPEERQQIRDCMEAAGVKTC